MSEKEENMKVKMKDYCLFYLSHVIFIENISSTKMELKTHVILGIRRRRARLLELGSHAWAYCKTHLPKRCPTSILLQGYKKPNNFFYDWWNHCEK